MAWTFWVVIGSLLGASGVGLGAFGAHALKTRLSPEDLIIYETAARYHLIHALAIIALGLAAQRIDNWTIRFAGMFLTVGILIFSGTLYALTLTGQRQLGMVTPIGGAALIIGWLLFALAAIRP